VNLDPTIRHDIRKTRPCLIISPDVTNKYPGTITVAAMTSSIKTYPTRVTCVFRKQQGQIVLDQVRSVDKIRLVKKLGVMDEKTSRAVCEMLIQFFKY
jgi:mRNA interferase MazF